MTDRTAPSTPAPIPAIPSTRYLEMLRAALAARLPTESMVWLDGWMQRVAADPDPPAALTACFPAAVRHLGNLALGAAAAPLATPCGELNPSRWTSADAGRACLLVAAGGDRGQLDAQPFPTAQVARSLFRDGDESERVSLVRALCLLPDPCSALAVAMEAGRVCSLRLYAALALDNPFPAACYTERDFNTLVLKCLFNALPIARIIGHARRANPALAGLCEDYRDERVLAERSVPPDIWLALAPHASERGLRLTLDALDADDPAHRYHAALALAALPPRPEITAALAARRGLETNPSTLAALG